VGHLRQYDARRSDAERARSGTGRRRLNEGDILVWNGFISKLGWNDFAAPFVEHWKQREQISDRTDIMTIPDLIDLDEGRLR
jgi:gluconokinase